MTALEDARRFQAEDLLPPKPEPPESHEGLLGDFWQLSARRQQAAMGGWQSIQYGEIESYQRMRRRDYDRCDVDMLTLLDDTWRATVAQQAEEQREREEKWPKKGRYK